MKEYRIQKEKLLALLEENKAEHIKEYKEAKRGFRKKAAGIFKKAMLDAKEGRKVKTYVSIAEPKDYSKDYDKAIKLITLCEDTILELNESQINNFIHNEWNWSGTFRSGVQGYSGISGCSGYAGVSGLDIDVDENGNEYIVDEDVTFSEDEE